MVKTPVKTEYYRLRAAGYHAGHALSAARTNARWQALESAGLVEWRVIPDEMADLSWLDQPEFSRQRQSEIDRANRLGCWGIAGHYRTEPGGKWLVGDSVWGFIGDDWQNSGYDPDIKAETISRLVDDLRARCPRCRH